MEYTLECIMKNPSQGIEIRGCYRYKLTEELWDSMSSTEKYGFVSALPYKKETIIKYAEMSWNDFNNGQKKIITGLLRLELSYFANKKFKHVHAVDRRIEICPDNKWYKTLKGIVK